MAKWPGPIFPVHGRLAGSLASRTIFPYGFTGDTQRKLEALDDVRIGKWELADKAFGGHRPSFATAEQLTFLPLPSNSGFSGWHAFRAHLRSLEAIVAEHREVERNSHPIGHLRFPVLAGSALSARYRQAESSQP